MRRREFRRKPPRRQEEEELSPHSRKIAKLFDEGSFQKSSLHEMEPLPENTQFRANQEEVIVLDEQTEERQENRQEMQGMREIQSFSRQDIQINGVNVDQGVSLESIQSREAQGAINARVIEQKPAEDHQTNHESNQLLLTNTNTFQNSTPAIINPIIDIEADPPLNSAPLSIKPTHGQGTLRICELYERMQRFRILCRVNHLSQFVSNRGTYCTKLYLIDEHGDEIICMLFQKAPHNTQPSLLKLAKGKTYLFQDGEVSKDEEGGLTISIKSAGIIEQHRFLPSFVPAKMLRVGDVQGQESSGQYIERAINLERPLQPIRKKHAHINVCGIFQGFKDEPKTAKNHFKVTGVLCDPDRDLAIHFSLLVDELSSFPNEGAAVSLHNVSVMQEERTLHLEGGKQGYILSEAGNPHEYFTDLLKSSVSGEWKLHEYRNLSLITYVGRTVSELKQMLARVTEHEFIYSEIDCTITSIRERRNYEACLTCRREVKQSPGLFNYCFTCRKPSKHAPRFTFDLELSDATGAIMTDLTSDRLEEYLGLSAEEFGGYGKEDRESYLQLCTYKMLLVRVKSERVVGGAHHKAVSAKPSSHKRSLAQIQAIAIEEKTKYVGTWQE